MEVDLRSTVIQPGVYSTSPREPSFRGAGTIFLPIYTEGSGMARAS